MIIFHWLFFIGYFSLVILNVPASAPVSVSVSNKDFSLKFTYQTCSSV